MKKINRISPQTIDESAMLKMYHGPMSIKSITDPKKILSAIFPNAPPSCRPKIILITRLDFTCFL